MRFSIITPSFRGANWLRLCIPSVADQEGVSLEHLVQDSCSDDGTLDWLPSDPRVKAFVEKDQGMYDAVNRGLRRSQGELLAYLNCDEQYLPGALKTVSDFFTAHPQVDVVFADMVVVDSAGGYICHRKAILPLKYHSQVCTLPVFTCSMFFRRKVIEQLGLYFDSTWRDFGDVAWVLKLLEQGVSLAILRYFTSAFTDSGENMNLKPNAAREAVLMRSRAPRWAQRAAPLLVLHHRLRRWIHGSYSQLPFDYSIYTKASPGKRVLHHVNRPSSLWKTRLALRRAPVTAT